MRVSLQLFASVRDLIGQRFLALDICEGATIGDLKTRLALDYPVLQPLISRIACAVDDEYAAADQVLHEGAAVALIPPVSGGAQAIDSPPLAEPFWITREPLERHASVLLGLVGGSQNGAIDLFYGVVR